MNGLVHVKMTKYGCWLSLLCALWFGAIPAQSGNVTVIISAKPEGGYIIPPDFAGLSFETGSELPNKNHVSGYLFSVTNRQLITLFRNAGIHNLRVGGGTVDGLKAAIPSRIAIDNVFAFARAVGDLKVTYSLRLLNGDPATEAATAHYIWEHYRKWLANFAIGNEPDWKSFHYPPFGRGTDSNITNYASYLARWRTFATAITNAAPGTTFDGPDTGAYDVSMYSDGRSWTQRFADDERNSGLISAITQHYYVGGNPGITTSAQAIDNMFSPAWVTNYLWLYDHNIAPVVADGLPYRLTEANDYLGGITNASDGFASALWALDFMHWWAAHGCAGVNFHNKSWLRTDTICLDSFGNYQINPKAYALKAFEIGGRGRVVPVELRNGDYMNLSVYAFMGFNQTFVTIINKEHGKKARGAAVMIQQSGMRIANATEMNLSLVPCGIGATEITLGGQPITNNATWTGQWTRLDDSDKHECSVMVSPSSAAIVRIAFSSN